MAIRVYDEFTTPPPRHRPKRLPIRCAGRGHKLIWDAVAPRRSLGTLNQRAGTSRNHLQSNPKLEHIDFDCSPLQDYGLTRHASQLKRKGRLAEFESLPSPLRSFESMSLEDGPFWTSTPLKPAITRGKRSPLRPDCDIGSPQMGRNDKRRRLDSPGKDSAGYQTSSKIRFNYPSQLHQKDKAKPMGDRFSEMRASLMKPVVFDLNRRPNHGRAPKREFMEICGTNKPLLSGKPTSFETPFGANARCLRI
ncbi:uncharacterized protein MELLADRAFT_68600 [Melampsora larici-populina 98AG31]|uniref:Uncharacterized protein n=1 Tax=Melampsora larici-populina (strain 98AG31 / pathotype 3-4-7) TaxID=747676 RepID=F4S7E2_MELLP|nr:uncharacterized protein MELLADRAFT_68600 [Melampsora larici-populina 98AG31]EGF99439.1 hypothetical protein MELLADRAFT_68600 [Melampsora larici-populina 98AG31]